MNHSYSMTIQWSDEDQTYIVRFPEWGDLVHTHGDTYEDAVKNGHELLDGLIASCQAHGDPLPAPRTYVAV
ncbi:MAG: type II toxin-antitoxin system HicB family antitoxin [Ktedonobacterales bacterium]|nr:type II toxin-antitoxin system HicB family antitoxin [Ktedonobacterales bacterium]